MRLHALNNHTLWYNQLGIVKSALLLWTLNIAHKSVKTYHTNFKITEYWPVTMKTQHQV